MSSKDRQVAGLVLAGVLVPVLLQVFGLALPLRRAVQAVASPLQDGLACALGAVVGRSDYARQETLIRRLQRENARLRQALVSCQPLWHENEFLKQRLRYVFSQERSLLFCRIISRDSLTSWYGRVQIDRGTADGLRPGIALVTEDGLVGRVIMASRHWSEVLLISDPASRIPCRLLRTERQGVVCGGKDKDGLELLFYSTSPMLQGSERPVAGDTVFTSGLGGQLPDGLRVGQIVAVAAGQDEGDVAKVRAASGERPREYLFAVLETTAPLYMKE